MSGTPIPVLDNSVSYGWRQMQSLMRGAGGGLMRDNGMRNKKLYRHILEKREDMALNGFDTLMLVVLKFTACANHPDRNTFAHGITIQSATSAEIKAAVVGTLKACPMLITLSLACTLYFNWDDWFYIASTQNALATGETPTATGLLRQTVEQELLQLPGVDRIVASEQCAS